MVELIQINSLALLNVSDHISREKTGKYGVLLGTKNESNDSITIGTSFEVNFDGGSIDWNHLNKKISLMDTVLPQYRLIGLYQINENISPNDETKLMIEQFASSNILIYVIFGLNRTDDQIAKAYTVDDLSPINTRIQTTFIESAATSTIINHQYYSNQLEKSNQLPIKDDGLSISLNQLESKMEKILNCLDTLPDDKKFETHKLVVHLSNRLKSYDPKSELSGFNSKAQSIQLSILTSQLAAIDNLNYQISKNLKSYGINSRSQSQSN